MSKPTNGTCRTFKLRSFCSSVLDNENDPGELLMITFSQSKVLHIVRRHVTAEGSELSGAAEREP